MKKSKNTPPKLAQKLLIWFLKDELAEEVLGDLDEKFDLTIGKYSSQKAKRNYWYQVINYMRPFAFKFLNFKRSNTMLRHNVLISYRSFLRFKGNFFINLIGLASGLACTLLIFLWVSDEWSVDKFHEKSDRIYQVLENSLNNGESITSPNMPGLLAQSLRAEFPEIEDATLVIPPGFYGIKAFISADEQFIEAQEQYVEPNFLKIFSFPLQQGNTETALNDISSILISESMALKLFNTTKDVLGKVVKWKQKGKDGNYIITGVFQNLPTASSQQFDVLLNYELFQKAHPNVDRWGNGNPYAYFTIKENIDVAALNLKISDLKKRHDEHAQSTFFIQKLSDRYLYGVYNNGKVVGGRIEYVRLFAIIAIVILTIACINFMNLATAKASTRLKEIGVKRALGAGRKTLVYQYLTESFLITILGVISSIFIAWLILPQFNQITGKSLSIDFSFELILALGAIVVITSLLAGSYPAFYLSRVNTSEALKGKLLQGFKDLWARKGLVTIQFIVSIVLIFCVLLISKQIEYIQTSNLGYSRHNVVYFNNNGLKKESYESFLYQIKMIPGIENASTTRHDLTGGNGHTTRLSWPGQTAGQSLNFVNLEMGEGFIETVGIKLLEGRTFNKKLGNIRDEIIFNETAIKLMGLENPIGKSVVLWGKKRRIIGVVKDFKAQSFYEPMEPTFIQAYPMVTKTMVKIRDGNEQETLAQLQSVYEEFNPGFPFEYKFMEEDYQVWYQAEQRVASLSKLFTVVAIIITILGLFGLTAFTTQRRSKEIGIRKALGCSSLKIVMLLTSEYSKIVFLALIVALPIGYFISNQWLGRFAAGIELDTSYFVITALITFALTWLTSGYLTIKAAICNPVQSLKTE